MPLRVALKAQEIDSPSGTNILDYVGGRVVLVSEVDSRELSG